MNKLIFLLLIPAVLFPQNIAWPNVDLSENSIAPVSGFVAQSYIDANEVIRSFENSYADKIRASIRSNDRYPRLCVRTDVDTLLTVIYEREMAFCRHVLEQISTISNNAYNELKKQGKAPASIRDMRITVLFDVDETIGSSILGWDIRPSIPLLFSFLKDHFNIEIGIASLRPKDNLLDQLDPHDRGPLSLKSISRFIDKKRVFSVYCGSDGMDEDMLDPVYGEFYRIFPGFVIPDSRTILTELRGG